jgi:hypothetical protein
MSTRPFSALFVGAFAIFCTTVVSAQDPVLAGFSCEDCCEPDEDAKCNYGPCGCQPRGTLLQWSYGTSFSGGPPAMDEPLVTDRPDFTESPVTVGRGVVQLETGYSYTWDSAGSDFTRTHTYPESLFRIGIFSEWLELRIFYNYTEETTQVGGVRTVLTGSDDLGLGLKIALTPQEGILPEMGLIPQMSVPSGDIDFSANRVLAGLNWVYAWEINDFFSLGGQSQYNAAVDGATGATYGEFSQAWSVGYTLTDRLGAYTEWYMFAPHSADSELPEQYVDGGFTYLVNDNLQLDIRVGFGLNEAADDYFLGSGFSQRF